MYQELLAERGAKVDAYGRDLLKRAKAVQEAKKEGLEPACVIEPLDESLRCHWVLAVTRQEVCFYTKRSDAASFTNKVKRTLSVAESAAIRGMELLD